MKLPAIGIYMNTIQKLILLQAMKDMNNSKYNNFDVTAPNSIIWTDCVGVAQ